MQGFFFSQMKGIYTKPKITLYLLMKDGMLSSWDQEQWGTRTSALTTFIQYWKFWPVQSGKKKKKFRLEKRNYNWYNHLSRIPRWLSGKESACNAGDAGLIPELGRSGEGNGNPLQYSGLETPMVSQKESDMTEQPSLGLIPLPLCSSFAASLPHPNIRFTYFIFLS